MDPPFQTKHDLKFCFEADIKRLSQHLKGEGLKHEKFSYANKWRIFQTLNFLLQTLSEFRIVQIYFGKICFKFSVFTWSESSFLRIRCGNKSRYCNNQTTPSGFNMFSAIWTLSIILRARDPETSQLSFDCWVSGSVVCVSSVPPYGSLFIVLPESKMRLFRTLNLWTWMFYYKNQVDLDVFGSLWTHEGWQFRLSVSAIFEFHLKKMFPLVGKTDHRQWTRSSVWPAGAAAALDEDVRRPRLHQGRPLTSTHTQTHIPPGQEPPKKSVQSTWNVVQPSVFSIWDEEAQSEKWWDDEEGKKYWMNLYLITI